MEMKEVRGNARDRMKGFCRVCVTCDGRACSGEVPGMGGLGTGSTFRANVDALGFVKLNMRVLHEAADPDTSVEILGLKLDLPVLAAPIGGVSFNMGDKVTESDYISSKLAGCKAKGIIGCTGDGVPEFIYQSAFAAISGLGGHGIPFIKPWEDAELFEKLDKAVATGAPAIGMDVDACGLVTLRKMGRPVSPRSVEQMKAVRKRVDAKFILKGIMTPDEARKAVDIGADAIVVSNHGGRVLDHAPGTADVLADVADAVKGQITVLADGGVRTGVDVLKFLALGADAVMIGRPFSIASIGGGQEGVETYLDALRGELNAAMVLTGTASAASVSRDILWNV